MVSNSLTFNSLQKRVYGTLCGYKHGVCGCVLVAVNEQIGAIANVGTLTKRKGKSKNKQKF